MEKREITREGQICPGCISKRLVNKGTLRIAWKTSDLDRYGKPIPNSGTICYECTHCIHYSQEKRVFL